LRHDPRAEEAFNRGIAATKENNWAAAEDAFSAALRWDAANAIVWYNRMCARDKRGDKDGALKDAQRVLAIDPKYPLVHMYIAGVLASKNDYKTGIEHLVIEVERDPLNRAAYQNLGTYFEQLRCYNEAYKCYEIAMILGGDRTMLLGCMHYAASYVCRWDWTQRCEEEIQWELKWSPNHTPPFQALCIPGFDRHQMLAAAKHTWDSTYGKIKPMDPPSRKEVPCHSI